MTPTTAQPGAAPWHKLPYPLFMTDEFCYYPHKLRVIWIIADYHGTHSPY